MAVFYDSLAFNRIDDPLVCLPHKQGIAVGLGLELGLAHQGLRVRGGGHGLGKGCDACWWGKGPGIQHPRRKTEAA